VQVESFLDEYKNDVVVVDFRAFQKKTVFTAFDPKGAGDVAHIDVDVETAFVTRWTGWFLHPSGSSRQRQSGSSSRTTVASLF